MLTSKSQPRRTAGAQGAPGSQSVDLGVLGGGLGSPSDFLCDLGQGVSAPVTDNRSKRATSLGTPRVPGQALGLVLTRPSDLPDLHTIPGAAGAQGEAEEQLSFTQPGEAGLWGTGAP